MGKLCLGLQHTLGLPTTTAATTTTASPVKPSHSYPRPREFSRFDLSISVRPEGQWKPSLPGEYQRIGVVLMLLRPVADVATPTIGRR